MQIKVSTNKNIAANLRQVALGILGFCAMACMIMGLAACAPSRLGTSDALPSASGIIGGRVVPPNDPIALSTALLIDAEGDQNFFCSASILNEEWLVTAAHCVFSAKINNLTVSFTGTFADYLGGTVPEAEIRHVKATFVNPRYDETNPQIDAILKKAKADGHDASKEISAIRGWGDLALVQLESRSPREKVPVAFLPAGVHLSAGQTVTIAGYGKAESEPNPLVKTEGVLRQAQVSLVDPAWGPGEMTLDNSDHRGACYGDSGGPAYLQLGSTLYLIGVTSHIIADSAADYCKKASAYTDITAYRDWIATTMSTHN